MGKIIEVELKSYYSILKKRVHLMDVQFYFK